MKNFLLGCAALALSTAPAIAQQAVVQQAEVVAPSVQKIEINQDGSLSGMVYAKVAGEETPVNAKITLAKNGVVIDSVQTESGLFSFDNITPGPYTISGSADGFTGAQTYDVGSYTGQGSSFSLDLHDTNSLFQQVPHSYQASPVYNAPVSATTTYGTSVTSASSYASGSGGVSSSGGFGGGRLIGRRFGRRGLLRAGLIGGVVAIAVDDNDVSADQ